MTTLHTPDDALSGVEFDSDAGQLRERTSHKEVTIKVCPGCGETFPSGGRGLGKLFCSDPCRQGFHQRAKREGGPMVPLVKAWHATRHAKPGTREAEICKFARGQLTMMATHWMDQDADAGRNLAVDYVGALMDSGGLWIDRVKG